MGFEAFEQNYAPQEQELLVLHHEGGGGSAFQDFWVGSAYFLAYVDAKTGVLYKGEGRLVWPVTEEEQKAGGCFGRFQSGTIYRVKARQLLDRTVPPDRLASFYNQFYVTEILKENVSCPVLEELLAAYRQPVVLQDARLGELTLNRQFSTFEGEVQWINSPVCILVDVDLEDRESWTKAIAAMGQMTEESAEWDEEMRLFAAKQLTPLANDWQEETEEEQPDQKELTPQLFAERIALRELTMTADGSFIAYYDDDDMFWGHSVTVYGTLEAGPTTAQIEG